MPYRIGGDGAGAFNVAVKDRTKDARSDEIIDLMLEDMRLDRVFLSPGSSVYNAGITDPVWNVLLSESGRTRHVAYVHAPKGIVPGAPVENDGPMTLADYSDEAKPISVRTWRAVVNNSHRRVVCEGWGLFDPGICSDGLPIQGWGTGCGLPADIGLIPRALMGNTHLPDNLGVALRLITPNWTDGIHYRLPARKSDQNGLGPVQLGMRFCLPPELDPNSRTVPGDDPQATKLLRTIVRTLQTHGAIAVDGSGGENLWGLLYEGPAVLPPPGLPGGYWGNLIRDWRADYTYSGKLPTGPRRKSDGIPWDQMRVLARSTF